MGARHEDCGWHVRVPLREVISQRVLNRTLLDRQMLLERRRIPPIIAVQQLAGVQAQNPLDPYTALWARLDAFDPHELGGLLVDRAAVRIMSIRGTLHLLTASDCIAWWPLFRPVYERELAFHPATKHVLAAFTDGEVVAWAREVLSTPHSLVKLKAASRDRFADLDPGAVALICRNRLGVVQTPPRGLWGGKGAVTVAAAEAWLGQSFAADATVDDLVRRYLRAFGPATAADIATWSRLGGIAAVIERLAPELRSYTDDKGRTLWDLADGTLADGDVPAPIRFLPEYDNVLLAHADRRRIADRAAVGLYPDGTLGRGHVLVDGFLRASWRLSGDVLDIRHLPLPAVELDDVLAAAGELASRLRAGEQIAISTTLVDPGDS
jgi:Winged helix DNA-binding domain